MTTETKPIIYETKISGVTYREREYAAKGVQRLLTEGVDTSKLSLDEIGALLEEKGYGFPWDKFKDGDTLTVHRDPGGKWSGSTHDDEHALAVVHDATGTWIGFIPAYNGGAKFISELMQEGKVLMSATLTCVTGGHLKKNGKRANRGFTVRLTLQ